jgi:hypothetical protein
VSDASAQHIICPTQPGSSAMVRAEFFEQQGFLHGMMRQYHLVDTAKRITHVVQSFLLFSPASIPIHSVKHFLLPP